MNNERPSPFDRSTEQLALGLGWFGIVLGAAELLAPRSVAGMIGVRADRRTVPLLRAFGVRQIASSVAILTNPAAAAPLWSRVVGDAVDLATLTAGMAEDDVDGERLGLATAAVLGVTALDVLCARRLSGGGEDEGRAAPVERRQPISRTVHVKRFCTVNRSIDEVYAFWKNFQDFPRFMRHLESVEILDETRSRWRAKAPAGMTVEWEAAIVEDREPEVIAWRSLPGAQVEHRGSVHFRRAPGARGTEVRVELDYAPPAGALGRGIAWLFREEPDQQIHDDLHRFKQLIETGEIPLSDGPLLWRAAQPPDDPEEIRRLAGVKR